MMRLINLIEEIGDIVMDAPKVPLSNGKVMIDREDFLDILEEIELVLPGSVNNAAGIKARGEEILSTARNRADRTLMEAREEAGEILDRIALEEKAKETASMVAASAEKEGACLKLNACDEATAEMNNLTDDIKELYDALSLMIKDRKKREDHEKYTGRT